MAVWGGGRRVGEEGADLLVNKDSGRFRVAEEGVFGCKKKERSCRRDESSIGEVGEKGKFVSKTNETRIRSRGIAHSVSKRQNLYC